MRFPFLRLPENLSFALYQSSPLVFRQPLPHQYPSNKNTAVRSMKAMLAAAVLLCGAAVRRVRGGIHLGSGSGRIGIVYVRHGSLRGRRLASN